MNNKKILVQSPGALCMSMSPAEEKIELKITEIQAQLYNY